MSVSRILLVPGLRAGYGLVRPYTFARAQVVPVNPATEHDTTTTRRRRRRRGHDDVVARARDSWLFLSRGDKQVDEQTMSLRVSKHAPLRASVSHVDICYVDGDRRKCISGRFPIITPDWPGVR